MQSVRLPLLDRQFICHINEVYFLENNANQWQDIYN